MHRVLLSEAEARDSGAWPALLPDQRTWHSCWQAWRRSVINPVYVASIAIAGLTILLYLIERAVI